jgi:hypothetical protein
MFFAEQNRTDMLMLTLPALLPAHFIISAKPKRTHWLGWLHGNKVLKREAKRQYKRDVAAPRARARTHAFAAVSKTFYPFFFFVLPPVPSAADTTTEYSVLHSG